MSTVSCFVRMRAKQGQADRVLELLLENPERIEEGEPGNLAFGVHRSSDDPNEFWLYEMWERPEAVETHERGAAFVRYQEELRPLVDPDSVLFGDTVPIKVLGYGLSPVEAATCCAAPTWSSGAATRASSPAGPARPGVASR